MRQRNGKILQEDEGQHKEMDRQFRYRQHTVIEWRENSTVPEPWKPFRNSGRTRKETIGRVEKGMEMITDGTCSDTLHILMNSLKVQIK